MADGYWKDGTLCRFTEVDLKAIEETFAERLLAHKESEQFVARYIERAPLSLEKLSIQDEIVTYTTKDGAAHEFDALEFLAALSLRVPQVPCSDAYYRLHPGSPFNLNSSAVAGLKIAHLLKISASFELSVLTLTVPGFKPPTSSKCFVLLSTCAIFILLNC